MSTKDFRAAVFGAIQSWAAANYPTVPVIYENGPTPDEDTIGDTWIDCEVRWYGARTLGIGSLPLTGRHSGAVSTQVYRRSAQGTGVVDDILESLTTALKSQRIGGGLIYYPQRTVSTNFKGWYKSGLLFPFTLDV